MRNTTELGKRIEEKAAEWFSKNHGGRLLEKNFRCKGGEIDLIFLVPDANGKLELVFVEVRGRAPESWVSGIESVTFPKLFRLSRAVRQYLARYQGPAQSVRVDLLGWNGSSWEHRPNVWPLPTG